jgi:hypothetical protein
MRGATNSRPARQYRRVHMDTGLLLNANVDSLSAFFPGLQAMMGDLESCVPISSTAVPFHC